MKLIAGPPTARVHAALPGYYGEHNGSRRAIKLLIETAAAGIGRGNWSPWRSFAQL